MERSLPETVVVSKSCQIEEGFVCVQQADHTNCTQIEKFTETITSGISTGQTNCGDSAPVFFPTDATDGTGYCMAVPDDIGHKVFSTTIVSGMPGTTSMIWSPMLISVAQAVMR